MSKEIPADLPPSTQEVYRSYLDRASLTRELLKGKVKRYIETISQARGASAELDIGTAGELGASLLRLLRECKDSDLSHVQAAVYYFVESEDAKPDLDSNQGFLDDAQVYNAVCRHIGMAGHQVDI